MLNKRTLQNEMWDQIGKEQFDTEFAMRDISDLNVDYADCLTLSSEIKLILPSEDNLSVQPDETPAPWDM